MQIFYDPSRLIFFINTRMKKQAAVAWDRADVAVQLAAEDRIYNATAVLHLVLNTMIISDGDALKCTLRGRKKNKNEFAFNWSVNPRAASAPEGKRAGSP